MNFPASQPGVRPKRTQRVHRKLNLEALEQRMMLTGIETSIFEEQWPGNETPETAYPLNLNWGGPNHYRGPRIQAGDQDFYYFSTLRPPEPGDSIRIPLVSGALSDLLVSVAFWDGTQFVDATFDRGRITGGSGEVTVALDNLPSTVFSFGVFPASPFVPETHYGITLDVPPIPLDSFDANRDNNSFSHASDLGIVTGFQSTVLNIHDTQDRDFFKFTLAAPARDEHHFAIEFEHFNITDLGLALYDQAGNPLDISKGPSSRHEVSLANLDRGTYHLEVFGDGGRNVTNPRYILSSHAPRANQPDSFEDNDSFSTAHPLGVVEGTRRLGQDSLRSLDSQFLSIHSTDDVDMFAFRLASAGTADDSVEIRFDPSLGALDLELYADGSPPAVLSTDSGRNGSARVGLEGLQPGTYYAVIHGAEDSANPDYSLTVRAPGGTVVADENDADFPNENRNQATLLGPVRGLRVVAGPDHFLSIHEQDEDWYQFELVEPADRGHFAAIGFDHSQGDLDLELYDNRGNPVAVSAGSSNSETIDLSGLQPGHYYLRVFGFDEATNPQYGLIINGSGPDRFDVANANDDPTSATELHSVAGIFQQTGISIHSANDEDWFRFKTDATALADNFISVNFDHTQGDVDLFLFDSNGQNLIARGEGIESGERIDLSNLSLGSRRGPLPAGSYLVKIAGFRGSANPLIQLTIAAPSAGGVDRFDRNAQSNDDRTDAVDLLQVALRDGTAGGPVAFASQEDPLSLHHADDEDWYKFAITGQETFNHFIGIGFDHTQGDLDIELYRGNGQRPVRTSAGVGNQHRIDLADLPPSDRYFLRVFSFDTNSQVSAYTLFSRFPESVGNDWSESNHLGGGRNNNAKTRPTDLGDVTRVLERSNLSIHTSGDQDWFRFRTLGPGLAAHSASISFDHLDGDLELELRDTSGRILRQSATVDDVETVSLSGLDAGTYLLRVLGRNLGAIRASNPRYGLRIDPPLAVSGDYAEPNSKPDSAFDLREQSGVQTFDPLSIHTTANQDWFRFTTTSEARPGNQVSIQFDNRLGDLDLFLFDSSGTRLLGSAETAQSTEVIRLDAVRSGGGTVPLASGEYLVQVQGHSGDTNPRYFLSINAPDSNLPSDSAEPNDGPQSASNLDNVQGRTTLQRLTIDRASDEDWYQFETTRRGSSQDQVSIQFDSELGDLTLELIASDGTTVLDRSDGSGSREIVSLASRPPGNYFARVTASRGTSPAYTLDLNTPRELNADFAEGTSDNNAPGRAYPLRKISGALGLSGLSLHNDRDQDWFEFVLSQPADSGQFARLDFDHSEADLALSLHRPGEATPITTSDTLEDFERVRLVGRNGKPLPAGTYQLKVFSPAGSVNAEYSLTILASPGVVADRYEPNDRISSAYDLRDVAQLQGSGATTRFFDAVHPAFAGGGFDPSFGLNPGPFPCFAFECVTAGLPPSLVNSIGFGSSPLGPGPIPSFDPLILGGAFGRFLPGLVETGTDFSGFFPQVLPPVLPPLVPPLVPFGSPFGGPPIGGSAFGFGGSPFGFGGGLDAVHPAFAGGGLDFSFGLSPGPFPCFAFDCVTAGLPSGIGIGFGGSPFGPGPIPSFDPLILGGAFGQFLPGLVHTGTDFSPFVSFLSPKPGRSVTGGGHGIGTLGDLSIERGDQDFFRFELGAEGLAGQFAGISFDDDLGDLKLALLSWSGNDTDAPVLLDSSNGRSDSERISLSGLPAGTYYLQVEGDTPTTANPVYQLQFNTSSPAVTTGDLGEPNNSPGAAHDLRVVEGRESLTGLSVHSRSDEDWFRFEITERTSSSEFVQIDFDSRQGDLDLELYHADGRRLIRSSRSTGNSEQVLLQHRSGNPLEVGTYLVRVAGYDNATNPDYDLLLNTPQPILSPDGLEPNNDPARGTRLSNATTDHLRGLTIHRGDEDHFVLEIPPQRTAGEQHSISVEFDPTTGPLTVSLQDRSGSQIVRSPVTQQGNAIIPLNGLSSGNYLLEVKGSNPNVQNRYSLHVDSPTVKEVDDWTILVYMTASDLAQFAFEDINELEQAAARLPSSVNLAVLYDQSATNLQFPTGAGTQAAWGDTGRAIIQPDSDPTQIATVFDRSIGEQNTGDPRSLVEFVEWAATSAPADHYGLIMWNHGQGIEGFNFDNADGGPSDALSATEMADALQQLSTSVQFRAELLAFDSCNMAMTELIHRFGEHTDVMVASQENVAGTGFAYDTVFSALVADPELAGADEVASGFVESFESQYRGNAQGADTLSAVETARFGNLVNELRGFSRSARSGSIATIDILRDARDAATSFLGHPEYRDLGQFMDFLANSTELAGSIRAKAERVRAVLSELIVARTSDQRNTGGLSIYLPGHGESIAVDYVNEYASFLVDSEWDKLLTEITQGTTNRPASLDPDFAESNEHPRRAHNLRLLSGPGNELTGLSLHNRVDFDHFRFQIAEAGGSSDRVQLSRSFGNGSWQLDLLDAEGLALRSVSGSDRTLEISLSGRPAGEYIARIHSPDRETLPRYSLRIDAPDNKQALDWAAGNTTPQKAFDLGTISSQEIYTGLRVEEGQQDWFSFQTPRNVARGSSVGSLQILTSPGNDLTVTLRKESGEEAAVSGTGRINLEYDLGTAFDYLMSVEAEDSGSFQLRFLTDESDTTAPVLSKLPQDLIVRATSNAGRSVEFIPPAATDNHDPNPIVECDPGSGTVFPIGITIVSCRAADSAGNEVRGDFTVTVQPPTGTQGGNVTARVNNGRLIIRGDAANNQLRLLPLGKSGTAFRVLGLKGTTVNGKRAPVVARQVNSGVRILAGAGNDNIVLNGSKRTMNVAGTLDINAGSGNDRLTARNIDARNGARFTAGAGNDRVTLTDVALEGVVTLRMQGGNDRVVAQTSSFLDRLILDGGVGIDTLDAKEQGNRFGRRIKPRSFER